MLHGIVLAAGDATRLPNKPLLPLKNRKPAITSGIDLLIRSGIEHIIVIVPPKSAIPYVLFELYDQRPFCIIEQHQALGVPLAISHILPEVEFGKDDTAIITYCDNVYGDTFQLGDMPLRRRAHTVIAVSDSNKAKYLSKYSDGKWLTRDHHELYCVAGNMILDKKAIEMCHHFTTTEQLLNYFEAQPIYIEDKGWWDIGTPSTYAAYWK